MLAIPALANSLASTKIPDSVTNLWVYISIQFCLYAIVAAIILYVSAKVVSEIENIFFRRGRYPFRYYRPSVTHVVVGIVIVSAIAIMFGSYSIFLENSNSLTKPILEKKIVDNNLVTQIPSGTNPPYRIETTVTQNRASSNQFTSVEESKASIDYVNSIRMQNGVNTIRFDSRVYNIAMARANDMDEYGYLDHTNPQTGSCPDSIKTQYGLSNLEYVAENGFGFPTGGHYSDGLEREAVDSWMTSRGHRYNLLYPHIAGAIACSRGGHCVFLGLNYDRFGQGCHTAAEGIAYWNSVGKQPLEN